MDLSQDFRDLLAAFASHAVDYLLIGGYAVAFHGRPRFTKDIDLWIDDAPDNLARVVEALTAFGAPSTTCDDVLSCRSDEIVWFGVPPARVDLLKTIPGVTFTEAYPRRARVEWAGVPVQVIAARDLMRAKEAAGREQDLMDARLLRRIIDA